MLKFFLALAFVPALVQARTPVRQCNNKAPLPAFVDINGCTSMPCQIRTGETFEAVAEGIVVPVATTRLLTYANIRVGLVYVPVPILPELEDACTVALEPGTCPVTAGQSLTFRVKMEDLEAPAMLLPTRVEVGVRTDDGKQVACAQLDVRIVR
ncbi:uncharacterized protein LOC129762605 [Toxorhynchites rutilus septentrionalis]|uniref:uncharacterized protein LOC129762605 n=1 Tax=Toxorhynchites rutilus septentrionalis TaxID=329112 RepID=UPI00247A1895|nr:uncharacterized protein LOC129762605 [Toxorhynchites rutilus septentrionalis]